MEETLHVEQHRAQDLLHVRLTRLGRVTFLDEAEVTGMPGQGVHICILWNSFFPVVRVAHFPVRLHTVLVHVLAEPFLRESRHESPGFMFPLGGVTSRAGTERADLRH